MFFVTRFMKWKGVFFVNCERTAFGSCRQIMRGDLRTQQELAAEAVLYTA